MSSRFNCPLGSKWICRGNRRQNVDIARKPHQGQELTPDVGRQARQILEFRLVANGSLYLLGPGRGKTRFVCSRKRCCGVRGKREKATCSKGPGKEARNDTNTSEHNLASAPCISSLHHLCSKKLISDRLFESERLGPQYGHDGRGFRVCYVLV